MKQQVAMERTIQFIKSCFSVLSFLFLSVPNSFAQAPPCDGNSALPGMDVCNATPICNFDGYCGRTNKNTGFFGTDTVAAWQLLKDAVCDASSIGYDCLTVDNDFYLKFIASNSTISFDIYVYDCSKPLTTKAIQIAVFSAESCTGGPVEVYYANMQLNEQAGAHHIVVDNLTPGEVYYVLLDGYSGQNCGFTFVADEGMEASNLAIDVAPQVTICQGESVTATVSGGEDYTWTGDNGLSATTGETVTITPPAIPGTYNYSVESEGGDAFCPNSSSTELTIIVEDCGGCVPPNIVVENINTCSQETVNLNTALTTSNGIVTFHNSANDAQSGSNAIDGSVTASGSYFVRASDPDDVDCFSVNEIVVNITNLSYTSEFTDPSCDNNDGVITLSVNGGEAPYTYSIDAGTTSQDNGTFTGLTGGTYDILITDANGCEVTGSIDINNPTGSDANFTFSSFCIGENNGPTQIAQIGGIFSFEPEPTDGATINHTTGVISNPVAGATYTVTHNMNDACNATHTQVVQVFTVPEISFTATPTEGIPPMTVEFENTSSGADNYHWDFLGNGNTEINNNDFVNYEYENAGVFNATLTGITNNGCTASEQIKITLAFPNMNYEFPNIFTPNGDNQNDEFKLITYSNIKSIDIVILNRWGNVVFEDDRVDFIWNGKIKNDGTDCADGVYFFKAIIKDFEGEEKIEQGYIHLNR